MTKYVISLGSNHQASHMLSQARERLSMLCSNIRYSKEMETCPVSFDSDSMFLNQIACLLSDMTIEEMSAALKSIESSMGRTPEQKEKGLVLIDLDLLIAGKTILRPVDMERSYVKRGIEELYAEADNDINQ